MSVKFPFNEFPPLKCVIAYGSGLTPRQGGLLASVPDFILVVDDSKMSLADWHAKNTGHRVAMAARYALFQTPGAVTKLQLAFKPSVTFYPLTLLDFPVEGGKPIQRTIKYVVTTATDLKRDLEHWDEFYMAGRLQRPALVISPRDGGLITGPHTRMLCTLQDEFRHAAETNLLNALRVSLLMSPKEVSLRDLVRTTASVSHLGKNKGLLGSRGPAAGTRSFLPLLSMYLPQFAPLRARWHLQLEEGDDEVLNAHYVPEQFRATQRKVDPSAQMQFDLKLEGEEDCVKIINEIMPLVEENLKESFVADLVGETGRPSDALKEAFKFFNSKDLTVRQSFSSEAHCSLFHSLPDSIQVHAIAASARARLGRIFNPLSLLDPRRDREILGGPLPWEGMCVESGLNSMMKRSLRYAGIKGMLTTGPSRVAFHQLNKLVGHISA